MFYNQQFERKGLLTFSILNPNLVAFGIKRYLSCFYSGNVLSNREAIITKGKEIMYDVLTQEFESLDFFFIQLLTYRTEFWDSH